MFQSLFNIFRIPELRNKVLFTLLMLVIYRIGFWVPLLGVDQDRFKSPSRRRRRAVGRRARRADSPVM